MRVIGPDLLVNGRRIKNQNGGGRSERPGHGPSRIDAERASAAAGE